MDFDNYYIDNNVLESKYFLTPSIIIENIIDCVSNKKPISFSKYGDGEYYCAVGKSFVDGHNCDYDNYTEKLSNGLKESFIYMTTKTENAYIGMWTEDEKVDFWKSLVESNTNINWAEYHTFIIDVIDFNSDIFDRKLKMYKTIQESSLKKYIICNPLLLKSKILLNATSLIHVPFQNWFDNDFDQLINFVCQEIGDDEQPIVITCCGMGAKVLIAELHKKYPKGIFLDFGSAMDLLCTKRDSRGRCYNYDHIYNSFSSILPKDWHDSKYEKIYIEAQQKLGLHIPLF
jgi:hypothetical protein